MDLEEKEGVSNSLLVPDSYELMAVLALGYPVMKERVSERKKLSNGKYYILFGAFKIVKN